MLAALAGSLTMYLVLFNSAIPSVFFRGNDLGGELWEMLAKTSFMIALILVFLLPLSLLPAAIFIYWSEASSERRWAVHLSAGLGTSACSLIVFSIAGSGYEFLRDHFFIIAVLAGGVAAGLVYWSVSGRRAGNWRSNASA
ncbi:MAG: hypothetical protein J0I86_13370 [Mesorhizobium sp.]|nr:hypothetical protein [Mesorhizobium sp.]